MYSYNVITECGERYGVDARSLKEAVQAFYADPVYGCAQSQDLVSVIRVDSGWS